MFSRSVSATLFSSFSSMSVTQAGASLKNSRSRIRRCDAEAVLPIDVLRLAMLACNSQPLRDRKSISDNEPVAANDSVSRSEGRSTRCEMVWPPLTIPISMSAALLRRST